MVLMLQHHVPAYKGTSLRPLEPHLWKGVEMRYEIKGKVIDQNTRAGVAGVRVEAWGKDLELDDELTYAATLYDGSFAIPLDEDMYRDLFHDKCPDIYFDVCCGDELLASTEIDVRAFVVEK